MEKAREQLIFQHSIANRKLKYTEFHGDGDNKSFAAVKNTYDVPMHKRECIVHVQKRVGNRLRKLKKKVKGLGGKGKLTDSMIDRFQNYYGIAIRSNHGNLVIMKKSIFAALFHCASSEINNWPKGKDSWCKFQQDIVNDTNIYIASAGLPLSVITHVKPIFLEVSEDSLLQKCLHGKTQNQNESFNGVIWQMIPKDVRVNKATFVFGVYDAVSHFNNGYIATLKTDEEIGLNCGYYVYQVALACNVANKARIDNSTRSSSGVIENFGNSSGENVKESLITIRIRKVLCIKLVNTRKHVFCDTSKYRSSTFEFYYCVLQLFYCIIYKTYIQVYIWKCCFLKVNF